MEAPIPIEPSRLQEFQKANLALWNEWTGINSRSEFYDLAGFKAGRETLHPVIRAELGQVTGKSLLHLQCHFGMDSLSLARSGAKVTGVDFSDKAIELARALTEDLGLEAEFFCSDIFKLPQILDRQYDIVFTSFGVLMWLPELKTWGSLISHFLRPGGTFYIAEIHPFAMIFNNDQDQTDLRVHFPYFHNSEPLEFKVEGAYSNREAVVQQPVDYEWTHSLGDVVSAVAENGLKVEFLHEFPFSEHQMFPFMEQGPDRAWYLKEKRESIPFTFSLKATKPFEKD